MTRSLWEEAPAIFVTGWIGIILVLAVIVWWAYTATKRKQLFYQTWAIIKHLSICLGLIALMFCAMMLFFSTIIMIGSFFR